MALFSVADFRRLWFVGLALCIVRWLEMLLFASGLFGAGFAVMQATLVYRAAPVEMRARLLGLVSVCIGSGPVGFLYLGFLAEMLTARTATAALAAHGIVAIALTRRHWLGVLRL